MYPSNKVVDLYVIPEGVEIIDETVFKDNQNIVSITIPSTFSQYPVSLFEGCINLANLNINEDNPNYKAMDGFVYSKDGKTLIYCPVAKTGDIVIPEGTEVIGRRAFYEYTTITSITLADSVITIGEEAFKNTSITTIQFSDNCQLRTIENSAFTNAAITNLKLPTNLETIGAYAFYGCSNIINIIFEGNKITEIGNSAFDGSSLRNVYYFGSQGQWQRINIGTGNTRLTSASITYNFVSA